MANLLLLFVNLAFFRASPADVPTDRSTLTVAVGLMVLINTAVTYTWYGLTFGLFGALLEVLLSGAFLYGCLTVAQHKARFEQSLAAMCGISAVMALCAWPWALAVVENPKDPPSWVVIGHMLIIMWSLLAWSRVLRLACEFPQVLAAVLSLGFFFFSAVVMTSVLPSLA